MMQLPAMTAKYEGLAYSTSDNTNDTSLRDVQIAPEFLFNYDKGGFTNHALDQVGGAKIKPADALAKNYVITYVDGEYTRQRTNFKPDLAIYGLPGERATARTSLTTATRFSCTTTATTPITRTARAS